MILQEEKHKIVDKITWLNEEFVTEVILNIMNNKYLIPQRSFSIAWNAQDIKNLIISLYRGFPIGSMTLWRIPSNNRVVRDCRSYVATTRMYPREVEIILDGLQRCYAFLVIFTNEEIVIRDNNLGKLNLYYNYLHDEFKYEDEIDNLDNTWISLKVIFDPHNSFNNKIFEEYTKTAPYLTIEDHDQQWIVNKRVKRLFRMIHQKISFYRYYGTDINEVSDLRYYRNFHKEIKE